MGNKETAAFVKSSIWHGPKNATMCHSFNHSTSGMECKIVNLMEIVYIQLLLFYTQQINTVQVLYEKFFFISSSVGIWSFICFVY